MKTISDSVGLEYALNKAGNGYTVVGVGKCADSEIKIPAMYEGLPVTEIGEDAFAECSDLTSITIPDSVTEIDSGAFMGCFKLTSITVADGNPVYHSSGNCLIQTQEKTLVFGCKASVIPTDGSVTAIDARAFYGCSGLTSITIPDSITKIGEAVFMGCTWLTSITIPDSVTAIGDSAFAWCERLTSITVSEGNPVYHSSGNCLIQTKEKMLISGCETSIIPGDDSVTTIGGAAFMDCNRLTSIAIPDGVTKIGRSAFDGCWNLTNIAIPDSVTKIDESAFRNCFRLTDITIPASVTEIGESAFAGCTGLTIITVAAGNPVYHSSGNCLIQTQEKMLISGCKTSVIPDDGSVTKISENAFEGCTGFTSITISDGVTKIGEWAFSACTGLTSIAIPDSLTEVGANALYLCSSLTDIYYGGTKAQWSITAQGLDVPNAATVHYGCKNMKEIINSTQPRPISDSERLKYELNEIGNGYTVISVGKCADSEVRIPAKHEGLPVTEIGESAFAWCTGLKSIIIPNSVTEIGAEAFKGCTRLTNITIPASVTAIGESTFAWCEGLKGITVSNKNPIYHSAGNCLIKTKEKTLISGCKTSVIPDDGSVTIIGGGPSAVAWA